MLLCTSQNVKANHTLDILKPNAKYKDVFVEEIISGDTFRIRENGEIIKLIGLKAPEKPRVRKKVERDKYGFIIEDLANPVISSEQRAYEFVSDLLLNKHVRIELDKNKNDDNFYTLGYVFLLENNLFVNAEILKQGHANLSIRPPNMKYADQLRDAYQEARREKRGLQAY